MNLGLKDCKAFIAGASKGLGKACAKALANESARVFICARNKEALKRAASECDAAGYSTADVSIPAEVKRVMAEAVTALGGLDASSPMPAVHQPLPSKRLTMKTGIPPISSI